MAHRRLSRHTAGTQQVEQAHRPGCSARAVGAQPGSFGCAPGAPNLVLTQCTISESLFGTLSMNTVHKFFSKIK